MKVALTPAAAAFLDERAATAVTVSSLVFSSCCSGPLAPQVRPGAPADPDGFQPIAAPPNLTIYYDSLLNELPELVIDCKDFGSYKELFVQGWE